MYVVIAYRFGWTNNSWYIVYGGTDPAKAIELATTEVTYRGGKYGCAVYQFYDNGTEHRMIAYAGSSFGDKEPQHNERIDYLKRLGGFMDDYAKGLVLLPDPVHPGRLIYTDVQPPQIIKDEVSRQTKILQGWSKARHADKAAKETQQLCNCLDNECEVTPGWICRKETLPLKHQGFGPDNLPPGWDEACKWAAVYCRQMFKKEWHDDSIAREYMAARNGYLAAYEAPYEARPAAVETCAKLCPNCGKDDLYTSTADDWFLYGHKQYRLVAKDVLFFHCMDCGLEYTGHDGEDKRMKAVQAHLARLATEPSQELSE